MAKPKTIREISSRGSLKTAFAIRLRVFVHEQGVPVHIEMDEEDGGAVHFLARFGGHAVGTARLVLKGGKAKIGRMAVLKSYRRKGIGKRLLRKVVGRARRHKVDAIFLHAQVAVIDFYAKNGFRGIGRVFEEAGIPHRKMILRVS